VDASGAISPGRIRARVRERGLLDRVAPAAAAGLVAYLALVPLGYLLWEAFAGDQGVTLEHFREAYRRDSLSSMAWTSLAFAAGSSLVAVVSGTATAFLVVRTDMPLRRTMFTLALLPLIVPGILYTIAWILLASPRIGTLRGLLPLDAFGLGGMILVEGLHLAPLVLLLMAAAFNAVDGTLEDAALMSGAHKRTVVRRVTLPLVRPALYAALLLTTVRALEAFEVPALLGIPGGTWVFTSRIWEALGGTPADVERAAAYSVPLLAIAGLGVFAYSRLGAGGSRYQTLGGRGTRPARIGLGVYRWPAAGALSAYLLLAVVAPLLALLYASTQRFYSPPSLDGLSRATAENYASLVEADTIARAAGNSVVLALGTATAVMVVMAAVAWLVVRTRFRGRWMLDALASSPLAIPGLVLGVALLVVYLRLPIGVYGTLWILFIAYFTRFMPYGVRYGVSALHQVSEEAEEAARTSGATWGQTFRRILLPLALPALLAGWLYVVILSMRELSTSILLYGPESEVLPVRIFALYENGQLPELAALGVVMTALLVALAALAWRLGRRVGIWVE
jgi:iron(III) transport system permease protein